MIHIEIPDDRFWQNQVEQPEVIHNDDTSVIIKIPHVSIIGILIDASNLQNPPESLTFEISFDGEKWFNYTIANRTFDGKEIEDTLYHLKLTIPEAGVYTYALDLLYKANFLKINQPEDSTNDLTIQLLSDTIW